MAEHEVKPDQAAANGHADSRAEAETSAGPEEHRGLGAAPRRMIQLQRSAGNQAVASSALTVQRRAPYTGKVSEVDDELRALITSERKILRLLGEMSAPEKRVILASFGPRLQRQFSFAEMMQAVRILGADLPTALDWLQGASIMTLAISYAEIQPLITRATLPQRQALNTPRWKNFFSTVCSTRTMVTAVQDLKFDLATQLDWIRSESGALGRIQLDLATLRPLLAPPVPAASLATVATPEWLPFWKVVCTEATMAELVDLLFPRDLPSKFAWMAAEGTTWPLLRGRITSATAAERVAAYDVATIRALLLEKCTSAELVDATTMLGGTLNQRLTLLAAKSGWTTIEAGILAATPADRLTAYGDDALKGLIINATTVAEFVEAVRLLGGTLAQKLPWLLAKPVDAPTLVPLLTAATEAERVALHGDPAFVSWVQSLPDPAFASIARILGGTPMQQMTLFGGTRPVSVLTWATPNQEWVDAIKAFRLNPLDMLAIARADLTWAPFIKPRLADWFRGRSETVVGADAVNQVWAAYGDGADFNSADSLVVFRALYGVPLAPAGTDRIFTTGTTAAGAAKRERYNVVAPNDEAARGFLAMVRPIPRSQVALAPIVFSDKYWEEVQAADNTWPVGTEKSLTTSFYWRGTTVIRAMAGGGMNTSLVNRDALGAPTAFGGGTLPEGMTALTYFQNHVRHEVGHAVGERRIGSMTQTGNAFATAYAGWQASSQASFLGAMWSAVSEPLTGWPRVDFGGGPVQINDAQVQAWLVGLLATKSEVAGPIKNGTKTIREKLAAIAGSLWGSQELVKYLQAVGGGNDPARIQDSAYQFTGYTPGSPVHIYSTRFNNQFATYSKAAFDALHRSTGWYSLSSPPETFAEVYTRKYSGAGVPADVNGQSWTTFFNQLEAQEDPMFGAPPPTRPPAGIAPPPGP